MNKTIHDRIKERLGALALSPQRASVEAGLSRDALRKLLGNPDQIPSSKTISALARVLDTSEQWLLTGNEHQTPGEYIDPQYSAPQQVGLDVPVLGTAAGSHTRGAFQLQSDPVDYVTRPASLAGAKGVYALYIEGTSMEPQYQPGDLVYIHPHRPPRIGDSVVIQQQRHATSEIEATIGVLDGRSGETITIRKHNPVSKIEIKTKTITALHKVLSLNEIFGAHK
jgi:phage repressor protein C with HTH and peptisase S24 domain